MTTEDTTVIGLNNDEANRVYRIVDKACAKNGCNAQQCSAIAEESAQEIHAAYERSAIGQAKRKYWPMALAAGSVFLTGVGSAIMALIMGWFEK